LGARRRGAGRALSPARAARSSSDQHDAHRVEAVATQEVGLRFLRGHRRPCGRGPREARARRDSGPVESLPRPRRLSEGGAVSPASNTAGEAPERKDYRALPANRVGGSIEVPGDKSISHRALMLGAVAEGETRVRGFLASEDCIATRRALEGLGVRVADERDGTLRIEGVGPNGLKAAAGPLDLGNSGTAIRLLTGLLAAQPFDSTLTGDASL